MLLRAPYDFKPQNVEHDKSYLENALHAFLFRNAKDLIDIGSARDDLTQVGSVVWTPSIKGLGRKFGGTTSDYLTTGAIATAQPPNIWSFELLFVANSITSEYYCGYQESPGNNTADRRLYVDSSGDLQLQLFDGAERYAVWGPVVKGQIYHAIASTDGDNLHLTVNGSSSSDTAVSNGGYASYGTPEFIIGAGDLPGGGAGNEGTDANILAVVVHDVYIPPSIARARTNGLHLFDMYGQQDIFIPVVVGGDVNVVGIIDTLVLAEGTATVSLDVNVTGIVDALTLSEGVATVSLGVDVTGITDTLTLDDTSLATINATTNILGITDALILDDTALATIDVTADTEVTGITDVLVLSEGIATVNAESNILGITAALVLDDTALASISTDSGILGITHALALDDTALAAINAETDVLGVTDALTIAEGTALINAANNILGITDALVLDDTALATISLGVGITGITDALTLAEGTAAVKFDTNVNGITDALVLDDTALATISLLSGTQILGITDELTLTEGVAVISWDRNIYGVSKALTLNEGVALISLAAPALPASSNSPINVYLGNVPQIDDPQVYEAVLQLHSAIEAILEHLNNP